MRLLLVLMWNFPASWAVALRERAERLIVQEMNALLSHDNAKYPLKVWSAVLAAQHVLLHRVSCALAHWFKAEVVC